MPQLLSRCNCTVFLLAVVSLFLSALICPVEVPHAGTISQELKQKITQQQPIEIPAQLTAKEEAEVD